MSRTYRRWSPEQVWMFPPSPRDWLPENPLDSFLMDVTGQVDLSPIFAHDEQGKAGGQPPFHPRMMVTLFIYAYIHLCLLHRHLFFPKDHGPLSE